MQILEANELEQICGGDCHNTEAKLVLGLATLVAGGLMVTNPIGWAVLGISGALWISELPGYVQECYG